MEDSIVLGTVAQILALFAIEYFNLHGFGLESALVTMSGLITLYLFGKDKKK